MPTRSPGRDAQRAQSIAHAVGEPRQVVIGDRRRDPGPRRRTSGYGAARTTKSHAGTWCSWRRLYASSTAPAGRCMPSCPVLRVDLVRLERHPEPLLQEKDELQRRDRIQDAAGDEWVVSVSSSGFSPGGTPRRMYAFTACLMSCAIDSSYLSFRVRAKMRSALRFELDRGAAAMISCPRALGWSSHSASADARRICSREDVRQVDDDEAGFRRSASDFGVSSCHVPPEPAAGRRTPASLPRRRGRRSRCRLPTRSPPDTARAAAAPRFVHVGVDRRLRDDLAKRRVGDVDALANDLGEVIARPRSTSRPVAT